MIVIWILNCVLEEIRNSMNFVHDVKSVWKELKEGSPPLMVIGFISS